MFITPLKALSILVMPLLLCSGCASSSSHCRYRSPAGSQSDSDGKEQASNRPRMTES